MTGETTRSHSVMPPAHVASEGRDIFMAEINGTGIAYQFDHIPNNFETVVNYTIPKHLRDPESLQGSIERFDRYRTIVRSFAPFPLSVTVPDFSSPYAPDKIFTREIDPELLGRYDLFSQALSYYQGVVADKIAGNADLDEVVGAAMSLCRISHPGTWDPNAEPGSPGYYSSPIRDTRPRLYLEAVMREVSL